MNSWLGIYDRLQSVLTAIVFGVEHRIIRIVKEELISAESGLRSFDEIQERVGLEKYSNEPDKLRELIIVAGGRRFRDLKGLELWGIPKRIKKPQQQISRSREHSVGGWRLLFYSILAFSTPIAFIVMLFALVFAIDFFNRNR